MKKIFGVFICMLVMNVAIGQSDEASVASFTSENDVNNVEGVYNFQFDIEHADKAEIDKKAAYYTEYFSVDLKQTEDLNKLSVSLKEVTKMNKKIMMRLFVSLNLDQVKYNAKTYETRAFFDENILN